jgi:hypothetical protein
MKNKTNNSNNTETAPCLIRKNGIVMEFYDADFASRMFNILSDGASTTQRKRSTTGVLATVVSSSAISVKTSEYIDSLTVGAVFKPKDMAKELFGDNRKTFGFYALLGGRYKGLIKKVRPGLYKKVENKVEPDIDIKNSTSVV